MLAWSKVHASILSVSFRRPGVVGKGKGTPPARALAAACSVTTSGSRTSDRSRSDSSRTTSWMLRLGVSVSAVYVIACLASVLAQASIMVAIGARDASLRVDAAGKAEVTWTGSDGARRSLVIDPSGSLRFGVRSIGADVSHATGAVLLPWLVVVRQTPDGRFYALQAWQRLHNGPVELRFSRWRGDPTRLTLQAVCCKWGGENIRGEASFHGKAIYGYHATPRGSPLDPYGRNVYLDTYRSGGWQRMMGILTHQPTGFFSLWIRPNWAGSHYRGTISGPNWGWTLGPDALAETSSSRP
jgi:hypothetical protein